MFTARAVLILSTCLKYGVQTGLHLRLAKVIGLPRILFLLSTSYMQADKAICLFMQTDKDIAFFLCMKIRKLP